MISRSKLKQYQQLHSKKYRQKYGLFVVEGIKSVKELLSSGRPYEILLCNSTFNREQIDLQNLEIVDLPDQDFNKISTLKQNQGLLAICPIKELNLEKSAWEIALDRISDPGNLGTIIRIADWYGINTIICSEGTADPYNPKVIQSSMGSFLRVQVIQKDLSEYLKNKLVHAAVLNGHDIRTVSPQNEGILLIGSEAEGIDEGLLQKIKPIPVTIIGPGKCESLNAAIATAICCERLIRF